MLVTAGRSQPQVERNKAEWIKEHFKILLGKELYSYTAEHSYTSYPKDDPHWITLTQNVSVENGWLITDDNVEIFKNGSLKICSRFEKGPIPGMTYQGYSCTLNFRLKAERGKVAAYISGVLFEGRHSIEIRNDHLIYVDGVDRTPAHLRVDPSKALEDFSEPQTSSNQVPEEEKLNSAPQSNNEEWDKQWAKVHFKAISNRNLQHEARVKSYPPKGDIWISLTKDVKIEDNWIITDDHVDIFHNDTFKITSRLEHQKLGNAFSTGVNCSAGLEASNSPSLKAEKGKVTAYICGRYFEGKKSIEIRKDKLIYVDGVDKTPANLRPNQTSAQEEKLNSAPTQALNPNATPEERLLSECSPELVAYIKSFEGKKSFSARIEEMNPPLTQIERDQLVGIVNGKMIDRPIKENNNKNVYDFSFALEVYENSVGFKPSRLSPSPETVANIEKSIQSIIEARKAKIQSVEAPHVSTMAKILSLMPKLSHATPQPAKKEEKVKPASSSQQDKADTDKWLADMRAMIARRGNVADVCIGTDSGNVNLSNTGTITGDDILRIQRQYQRKPG